MRYALIRNNVVINLVEWDGVAAFVPPPDLVVIAVGSVTVDINWTWNNGVPVNPNPPSPPPTPPDRSVLTNQDVSIRAAILAIAALTNLTVPQVTVAFAAAYRQLNGS